MNVGPSLWATKCGCYRLFRALIASHKVVIVTSADSVSLLFTEKPWHALQDTLEATPVHGVVQDGRTGIAL